MTQNSNSLLPDGYRFWLDDTLSEPLNDTKSDAANLLDTFETDSQNLLASESLDSEIEPISVEDLKVKNSGEPGLFSRHHSQVESSELNESTEFTTLHINQPRATKFDAPSSVLAGFWLKSLEQSEIAEEYVDHQLPNFSNQEPSAFWRCDTAGAVVWFKDQNGNGWSRNSEHQDLFSSDDGGERAANVQLTSDGCSVEDSDGTILKISFSGTFSIQNCRKSREKNIRSLMEIFCSVDANGDERLSLSEIENALRSCNETDRPLIHSIKTHFRRIEWSRRGMFGQVADGLSLRDILDLTSSGSRTSNDDVDETLLAQIETVIDFIDPKRSGIIEHNDLENALRHLVMPARLRSSIELLVKRLKELSLFGEYGFSVQEWHPTRQDIRWMLCDLFKQSSFRAAVDMPSWASLELGDTDRSLYASSNDPNSSITIDAIKNCPEAHQPFMAAVAAAIVHCPELVLQTIRRSDNGAFVVTFIGDRQAPMRVLLPAQKEIHDYGRADQNGVWALILARAFAQYLEQQATSGKHFHTIHEIAQLFVGQDVETLSLKEQCSNELAKLLDQLWAQDRMLMLCRFPNDEQNVSTSVLKHTCAITGWEPQTGVLSIFNSQSESCEQISIDELRTTFDLLLST